MMDWRHQSKPNSPTSGSSIRCFISEQPDFGRRANSSLDDSLSGFDGDAQTTSTNLILDSCSPMSHIASPALVSSQSLGAINMALKRQNSNSSSSNESAKSAPPPVDCDSSQYTNYTNDQQANQKRSIRTKLAPTCDHNQNDNAIDLLRGYLKISAHMIEEMFLWRRSLVILILAFLYATFALTSVLLRSRPSDLVLVESHKSTQRHLEGDEWTQEMIAGWYRDNPLNLSREVSSDSKQVLEGRMFKVRECQSRSYIPSTRKAADSTTTTTKTPGGAKNSPRRHPAKGSANTTTTTVAPKLAKRKRRFEALNGCLFRLNTASESLGDLCCCAGIPRYILVQPNITSTTTSRRPKSSSKIPKARTSLAPRGPSNDIPLGHNSSAKTLSPIKKYLKPQLMCFVTAAADLFNSHKLPAPIVNEYSLRNAFIRDRGKCISCSCCHEHETENVNKLIANVPLDDGNKFKSMMLDKNGNQLTSPSNSRNKDISQSTFWAKIRDQLVHSMRYMDEFYFWLYDFLVQSVMTVKYGVYPANYSDATGIILAQSSLVPLDTNLSSGRSYRERQTKEPKATLMIDTDAYDDFTTTTTTTSTTTTTTTKRPKSRRRKSQEKRRRRRRKRRRRNRTTTTTTTTTSTTTSTVAPTLHSEVGLRSKMNISGLSSTKVPTVIINFYAGDSKQKLEDKSTTTQTPSGVSFNSSSRWPLNGTIAETKLVLVGPPQSLASGDHPTDKKPIMELKSVDGESIHKNGDTKINSGGSNSHISLKASKEYQPNESPSSSPIKVPVGSLPEIEALMAINSTSQEQRPKSSSIIISLDQGNSTTIIATTISNSTTTRDKNKIPLVEAKSNVGTTTTSTTTTTTTETSQNSIPLARSSSSSSSSSSVSMSRSTSTSTDNLRVEPSIVRIPVSSQSTSAV